MNEINEQPAPQKEAPAQGSVMDIQPPTQPAPQVLSSQDQKATPASVSSPASAVAHEHTVPVEAVPEPSETQTAPAAEPVEEVLKDASDETVQPLLEARQTASSSRFRPAIAVAIVVGLALSGIAVYAYLQSNRQATTHETHQTSEAPQPTPQNAVIQDIEEAQRVIDEAISTDIDADFPESELTDETLGL